MSNPDAPEQKVYRCCVSERANGLFVFTDRDAFRAADIVAVMAYEYYEALQSRVAELEALVDQTGICAGAILMEKKRPSDATLRNVNHILNAVEVSTTRRLLAVTEGERG